MRGVRAAPRRVASLSAVVTGGTGTSCGSSARRWRRRWPRCDPWHCDFESHGACVEFEQPPARPGGARRPRVDRAARPASCRSGTSEPLRAGASSTARRSGVRLLPRRAATTGCTDYLEKTFSVRLPAGRGRLHRGGRAAPRARHYELGDPMHRTSAGRDVEAAVRADGVGPPRRGPRVRGRRYHGIRSRRCGPRPHRPRASLSLDRDAARRPASRTRREAPTGHDSPARLARPAASGQAPEHHAGGDAWRRSETT